MKKINSPVFILLLLFSACSSPQPEQNITVKNGDVNIAYTKSGNSDTAIVFVHGWGINKEYWKSDADKLNKRYTIVALDLGGHGASGHNRGNWTIDDFAGDVIATIDSFHLNKVILVGHSMGGDIILDAANKLQGKIIGLIGIDNFKDVGAQFTQEQRQQIDSFIEGLHKNYKQTALAFSRGSLFPPNYADTTSVNRVLKDIGNMDSVVATQAILSALEFTQKEKELLMQLPLPLHLIVSDYTPTMQDSLAKYCKSGYAVKTIHGTGHYPMIEKPAEFNQLLDETIDEISKGK